jgi:hypothetical protein
MNGQVVLNDDYLKANDISIVRDEEIFQPAFQFGNYCSYTFVD